VVVKNIPEALFCDRNAETDFLIKQIENGRNTVMVSPRRMGKTGLLQHLFRQQKLVDNYETFFIDLYAVTSLQEMSYLLGKTVFERLKSQKEKHIESFFQIIKSLRAGFKIDSLTGEPKFELGIGAVENPVTTLEEVFAYLESAEYPCVLALDEFQQVAELREKRVEALLRGLIQQCSKTSFIFSGSKQHTISQMFQSKAKPFYQSAQLMDLRPLELEVYTDFVTRLFSEYGKSIEKDVVEQVYENYDGVTWYMQMMMNELFSMTEDGGNCSKEDIEKARHNITEVQEGGYKSQLNNLSDKQKRVLQAISKEGVVDSVTSGNFVRRHALESASSVQSAIKGLLDKEIISHTDGHYRINDYFFSEWLRENY
jgi:AAA+ ATPase superfamily predicted ATPase